MKLKTDHPIADIEWHSRSIALKTISPYLHIWSSKHLLNFASTAHRLYQMGHWISSTCHYCNVEEEIDTFYSFRYRNRAIAEEKEEVLD